MLLRWVYVSASIGSCPMRVLVVTGEVGIGCLWAFSKEFRLKVNDRSSVLGLGGEEGVRAAMVVDFLRPISSSKLEGSSMLVIYYTSSIQL